MGVKATLLILTSSSLGPGVYISAGPTDTCLVGAGIQEAWLAMIAVCMFLKGARGVVDRK